MTAIGSSFGDPGVNPYVSGGSGGGTVDRSANVNLNANTSAYQAQMGQAADATNKTAGAVSSLLDKVDHLFKMGGRALKIVGAADVAAMTGAAATAGQLEQQLGTLHATSTVNGTSFKAYGNAVDSVFSKFPSHRGDVVALVTELSNMSVKSRDLDQVATSMTKLGAATGESIPELTSNMVQLDRQMGVSDANTGKMANSLLTVSKNAGVGANNVLQFAQSIAPISRQAGIGSTAVLGISTAFTKAGADGFVAANTFNSIVNDITTLTKTGSPELQKYASFIGMTAAQFRKLPAKTQITDLFAAIAKGGPQALNFVQELGLGTRALSAVQAVSQQGGMEKYINIAERNAGNTKNLDRGSAAALGGMNDAFAQVHNQLTRFATMLGAPLLTPITWLAHGLSDMLGVINSIVKSLGPLPAMFGVLAGALAPIAGLALSHMGILAAVAGVRMLRNSGSSMAVAAGRQAGKDIAANTTEGMTAAERAAVRTAALNASPMGARFAEGSLPMRASLPYRYGMWQGGSGDGEGGLGRVARLGLIGGMRGGSGLGQWYFNQQRRWLADGTGAAANDPLARSAYTRGEGAEGTLRGPLGARLAARARAITTPITEEEASGRSVANVGVRSLGNVALAAGGLGVQGIRTGTSMLGSVGSGLGRAMTSPWMLPAMLAFGGVTSLMGSINDKAAAHGVNELSDNLDPMRRYNDALGIATGKLANFSTATDQASRATAGAASTATSFSQVQQGPSDAANSQFANKGSSDKNISALKDHSVSGAVALMQSYNFTDPRQLDLFGQNLLGAGYDRGTVTKILGQYRPNAGVNYKQLGKAAWQANANGGLATNPSTKSNDLNAAALTSLSVAQQNDLDTHSTKYTEAKYLRGSLTFLGSEASGVNGSDARRNALNNALAKLTNGKAEDYSSAEDKLGIAAGRGRTPWTVNRDDSAAVRDQKIMRLMEGTKSGRTYLNTIAQGEGFKGSDAYKRLDPTKLDSIISAQVGVASDKQIKATENLGPLGTFATHDKDVVAAGGASSGDPVKVQLATEKLASQATAATGGLGGAAGALMHLSDTMGGASTASGKLIASAAEWARTLQGFKMPYLSREGQLAQTASTASASARAAAMPGASAATVAQAKTDRIAFEGQKASYNQFLIDRYKEANAFGVQMQRSQEDYNLSVSNSQRNFNIQMQQAQEDYHTSVSRSERNFRISTVQGEQDYLETRGRNLQDFNRTQARNAQAAAESIYSPFTRVQSQSVMNGGMLLSNLQDQNQRIQQQDAQLVQLRRRGLSQGSIDTLKLGDSSNAQQVNSLVNSTANDPKTISAINQAVKMRQGATTKLTQSSFNEEFRHTVEDFSRNLKRTGDDFTLQEKRAAEAQRRSLADMATDFERSQARAVSSQRLSLNDMARSFNTMTKRATQDLKTSMTQIYGNFGQNYDATLKAINAKIGKYAPQLAATLVAEMKAADAAINGAAAGIAGGGGSGGYTGSLANLGGSAPFSVSGLSGAQAANAAAIIAQGKKMGMSTRDIEVALMTARQESNFYNQANSSVPSSMRLPHQLVGHDHTSVGLFQQQNSWGSSATRLNPEASAALFFSRLKHVGGRNSMSLAQEAQAVQVSKYPDAYAAWENLAAAILRAADAAGSRAGASSRTARTGPHGKRMFALGGSVYGQGVGDVVPSMLEPGEFVVRKQVAQGIGHAHLHRLNSGSGFDFLRGMQDTVSRDIARQMQGVRGIPGMGSGGGHDTIVTYHQDYSTRYSGDIEVKADDPLEMERKLAARQRLKRLTSPVHAGN